MTGAGWGPLAVWQQARRTCDSTCLGYHATWPLTRAAGLKASPRWHTIYYRTQLLEHPRPIKQHLRVLVAGAADHTVLAVLNDIISVNQLSIVVVDRCATPLVICQRFALDHGLDVICDQRDLQDLPIPDQPYDLAICDGVLSLLDNPAARHDILARLADALGDTGLLVYTTRLTPAGRQLEYDGLGRLLQSFTTATASRHVPSPDRLRTARQTWQRPARATPYTTLDQLRTDLRSHFAKVLLDLDHRAPTTALRLHPRRLWGATCSVVVRASATNRVQVQRS